MTNDLHDCHETKNEHIDWTPGLKCSHQFWNSSWPWPLIFKAKFLNSCILRNGRTDGCKTKRKHIDWLLSQQFNIDLGPHACRWPGILKVNFWNNSISGMVGPTEIEQRGRESVIHDHEVLVINVSCEDVLDIYQGDFRCRRAVDSSSLEFCTMGRGGVNNSERRRLRWIEPNSFSTTASISAQPRWLY